jgi:myo-inositol 2-dehydrogenase/D-chiro-inositol 1-dehydrogenase
MPLRIAYIGAGSFSNQCMFPQLSRHDLDPAAICDLDGEKASLAQRRYGFREVYTDFRRMLEEVRPQAVFCVGGPKVHYPVGLEVLDRGYPLYVQKPPAPGSRETREMADLAARRGVVCHVGFNLRLSPAAAQARAIVGSREFGRPLMGVFRYGLCSGATMADVVMDQHCHLVDLARHLMGEIRTVMAVRSAASGARDYVATVAFESGAVGSLNFTSGQIPDKEFLYFEVTGNRTFCYSHDCAGLTWFRPSSGPWWKETQADHVYRRGLYGGQVLLESYGYVGDVANFLAAVKGEEEDASPIRGAVGTVEICEEILRQVGSA